MAGKPKQEFTADDWPLLGNVNERGFCVPCRSFWCPHAAPSLYAKRDLHKYYNGYVDKVAAGS